MSKEIQKVKFETRAFRHPNGSIEKKIYINNEEFDWSIDISSFQEARKMGPQFMKAVQDDIAKHYVESISDFLGRKVTIQEVIQAIKTGWI
jgi:hypothetical protein